ncbi:hypothetical protein GCM10010360_66480 [Streptomyces nogalater]
MTAGSAGGETRTLIAASEPGVALRGNRSFRAYWAGEAVTLAGTSAHGVPLPVVAVLERGARARPVRGRAAAGTLSVLHQAASVAISTRHACRGSWGKHAKSFP